MALGLFKFANGTGQISDDNTYSNPIVWQTSAVGGQIEAKYYLKMENATQEYLTTGRLYAVDVTGEDESGWFSFAPDESGVPGDYASDFEFEIPLGSEVPVWIKLVVPGGIENDPKDDVRIAASYMQHEEPE